MSTLEVWDPLPSFRSALLRDMQCLWTVRAETPERFHKELSRVNGAWMRYRHQIRASQAEPGQAKEHFLAFFWNTPEWKGFAKFLTQRRQQRPKVKEAKRVYAKEWYQEIAKAKRSTPEVREKLARQRRERYAAQMQKASSQEASSAVHPF